MCNGVSVTGHCQAYSLHIPRLAAGPGWRYAVHIDDSVAGLFTPYREGGEAGVRVTGIRDLEGSQVKSRPERMADLVAVARR